MAPIANPHVAAHALLTFGGTYSSGADSEIWQCGLKLGQTFPSTSTPPAGVKIGDLQNYLNSIKTPLLNWFTAAGNGMRADYKLTFAKVANIAAGALGPNQPGGKYDGTNDAVGGVNPALVTWSTGNAGPAAITTMVPPLLTLAFSFRSIANARARAGARGRIYPPFGYGTNSNRAGSGSVTIAVTSAKALLTAVSSDTVVVGGLGGNSVRPCLTGRDGSVHVIDQVAVGDVVDVQRRRKNALVEAYTTSVWP